MSTPSKIYLRSDTTSYINGDLTIAGDITVDGPLTVGGNPAPTYSSGTYTPYILAKNTEPNPGGGNVFISGGNNFGSYELFNGKICVVTVLCGWSAKGAAIGDNLDLAALWLPFEPAWQNSNMKVFAHVHFSNSIVEDSNVSLIHRQHVRLELSNANGRTAVLWTEYTPANGDNSSEPVYLKNSTNTPRMKDGGIINTTFWYPVNETSQFPEPQGVFTKIKTNGTLSTIQGALNVKTQFKALGNYTLNTSALVVNSGNNNWVPRLQSYQTGKLLTAGITVVGDYAHFGKICYVRVYYLYSGDIDAGSFHGQVGINLPVPAALTPALQWRGCAITTAIDGVTGQSDDDQTRRRRCMVKINPSIYQDVGEFRFYVQNVGNEKVVQSVDNATDIPFFKLGPAFTFTFMYLTENAAV